MAKLFSDAWMQAFGELWNHDPKMLRNLAGVDFYSHIGYGFRDEDNPRGYLYVDHGKVVTAATWNGEELNWDLRAAPASWKKWIADGFGLQRLGAAVVSGELVFRKGDYRQMVHNVRLSVPFLRHFELMQDIKTEL